MNEEKPRLRSDAFSSSARPRAPLCEENAIGPGGSARGPNVALSDGPETAMPRQFGPTSRPPCERTSASSCSCRSRPSAPTSAKPAEMTQSARTPVFSAESAASRTCAPGRQMTARSTCSGSSSIDVYARTPATGSPLRFTGYAAPLKSPERMFRNTIPPIASGRERGSDHGDGGRGEERLEGGDDREVVPLLDMAAVGLGLLDREGDLERPAVELPRHAEARVLEHAHHRGVVAHHLGDEALDAYRRRPAGELFEHAGADAAPLLVVSDRERDFRRCRVAKALVARERDDPVARASRRASRARPSRARGTARRAPREPSAHRGTSGTGCAPRASRRTGRAHPSRRPQALEASACRRLGG